MIELIIVLAIFGVVVWLVTTKLPIDPAIKVVIQVVAVLLVILYLVQVFGLADIPIRR